MAQYEPVIGLEVHTELNSLSKVFCADSCEFGAAPNSLVSPISLGLPGTLPVLNDVAFDKALKTAMALGCEIPNVTTFDRKHYYYPDLPKNYQISQEYQPLGRNGEVTIALEDGSTKRIGIDNIHLEEDAGKLVHPEDPGSRGVSWVDLNRAGMPLLEIVTDPDLRSLAEMEAFMRTLRSILRYLDVSDCKMEEGSIRFEVNLSMREVGAEEFGTKVEVKNVGSLKAALRAARYEMIRQTDLLEEGKEVVQQTCLWDDDKGETRPMRSKEVAKDYRYLPDPDLPPVHISEEWLARLKSELPELRDAKKARFLEQYAIPDYDAGVLVSDQAVADFFEACCAQHDQPKTFSNWIMVEALREVQDRDAEIDDCALTVDRLVELVKLVEDGTLSHNVAKEVLRDVFETDEDPSAIVEKKGLRQESDEDALLEVVREVIAENPEPVAEFREGKDKAIGFLMGQIKRKTQGKANPKVCIPLFKREIRGE